MEELVKDEKTADGLGLMEQYEKVLLGFDDVEDVPAVNCTNDGILIRKCFMQAGKFVSGHEHLHSHWNIVLTGRAIVSMNGESYRVQAGDIFVSQPHVRKGLYIIEDMEWVTVHHNPKNLTDNDDIEKEFVTKSGNYYNMNNQIEGAVQCLSE